MSARLKLIGSTEMDASTTPSQSFNVRAPNAVQLARRRLATARETRGTIAAKVMEASGAEADRSAPSAFFRGLLAELETAEKAVEQARRECREALKHWEPKLRAELAPRVDSAFERLLDAARDVVAATAEIREIHGTLSANVPNVSLPTWASTADLLRAHASELLRGRS